MTLEEAVRILKEKCELWYCGDCPLYDKNFEGDTTICALLSQAQDRLERLRVPEKADAEI